MLKTKEQNTEEEFLVGYNENEYKRPSVTNDVLIFTTEDYKEANSRKIPRKGMQVLLTRRDKHPNKDKWAIPGGFVKSDEDLESGAQRKLKEKTGIDKVYIEQLYTFGDVKRDTRTRVISIGNLALVAKENLKFKKEKDQVQETSWFWIDKKLSSTEKTEEYIVKEFILILISEDEKVNIKYKIVEKTEKNYYRTTIKSYELLKESTEELAFDHYQILDYGIDRLRNKIQYTPIAFNILPRLFTVKELQYVYEAIMGRGILNFRRKMGDMIIETDEKIEGKPYRPAQVFKFNEDFEHSF